MHTVYDSCSRRNSAVSRWGRGGGILLHVHYDLRQQYPDRFWTRIPIETGLLLAYMMLVFRTLVLQHEFDRVLVAHHLEWFFWAGYWAEWWTGLSRFHVRFF